MHKRPDDVTVSSARSGIAVRDRDRIVAAHDRAEIARGREMVVEPAIDDEEGLAAALLPVDHPREIHACFADQPAPQLDREVRIGELPSSSRRQRRADRLDVERHVAGEIGNAEPAAQIDQRRRAARFLGEPRRQRQRLPPGLSMIACVSSDCDPAKMWKPRQSAPPTISRLTSAGDMSASTPKGEARPPILIPDPRNSKSGFTRTASRGASPARSAIASARCRLALGFDVERHPRRIASSISASRLPGPAKLIALRRHDVERPVHFARRGDVEPVDQRRDRLEQRRNGLALIA